MGVADYATCITFITLLGGDISIYPNHYIKARVKSNETFVDKIDQNVTLSRIYKFEKLSPQNTSLFHSELTYLLNLGDLNIFKMDNENFIKTVSLYNYTNFNASLVEICIKRSNGSKKFGELSLQKTTNKLLFKPKEFQKIYSFLSSAITDSTTITTTDYVITVTKYLNPFHVIILKTEYSGVNPTKARGILLNWDEYTTLINFGNELMETGGF